uniref:NB-ARC domain-containing protein n=1 Tax=Oryza rufipogon TaxID=4529 RepID=A0A0E0N8X6_ORYRU
MGHGSIDLGASAAAGGGEDGLVLASVALVAVWIMGLVATAIEAAIGWVVESILGNFFTGQMQVWTREVGLSEEVEELETEMRSMQMVLAAAESSKIDNRPLSESLDELKELLYDAEDVMDELDYYRLQQHIEGGKGSTAASCTNPEGSYVSSSTPSYFQRVSNSINHNISWPMHGKKRKREEEEEQTHSTMLPLEIKHDISKRINEIVNCLRTRCKPVQGVLQLEILRQIAMPKHSQSEPRKPRQTTSLAIEHKVYGRDTERDNIIELLTKVKSCDLGVLPLVGVGGVGKTTLARFVYHDQRIKDHFDLRMWVCVSDNFNEKNLTHEMLELVCKDRQGYKNIISFDVLQNTLWEEIRGKRFLLILDDMWEDGNRSGWDKLLAPLKCNEEWAFLGNEKLECNPTLQSIGKHIAKALKGNPLAARSVGALLNRSVSFDHWRKVQHKWKFLLKQDDDILAILKFSYEFLPVHLQHCFSYCSLFPKDHKFNGKKLVRAWISQNFVKCECRAERLEETGKQYLDNLVDWGFFEEVESHYVMHDLMHDLAEEVSSDECDTVDGLESKKISPGLQHLSIITTAYDREEPCNFPREKFENILQSIGSLPKLRTLMFFGENSIMLLRSLNTICKESKRLRLLKIYVTAADISSTHNLFKPNHLRYLEFIVVPTNNMFGSRGIVNTSIPQALTKFYHLQVLDVSSKGNLAVPTGLNNLINLRHLIAHEKVHSTIAGLGNLTSLQELIFKVQDADNFNIGQLRALNELVILGISQLENVKTKQEASSARMIDKEHLEELSLLWNDNSMNPEPTAEKTRDDVIEGLEPLQNLKHLQLIRYSGATSPTWLASRVTSLQVLHLENCRQWQIVQSLEMLPLLRKLKLIRMWNLMEVSIPSCLEELDLVNVPKLEKCVGTYGLDLTSGLRVLIVKDCPILNEFTFFHKDYFHAEQKSWFPSLNKLIVGRCHRIITIAEVSYTYFVKLCYRAWKILPLEEMQALKKLELMDVPVVEELSVPSLEKLVLIQIPRLQSCRGITTAPSPHFSTSQGDQRELVCGLRELTINDCPSLLVQFPIPPSSLISFLSIKGLSSFPTMVINRRVLTIESNELSELDGRISPFHNLKGITWVNLRRCPNLTRISIDGFSQPHVMSKPVHDNSIPITSYPVLPSVNSLSIQSCGIAGGWLTLMLPHLQSLENLELRDCPQIKLLSTSQCTKIEAPNSLASAETTSARDKYLLQIPYNLLRSLKRLIIWACRDLEFSGVNEGFGGFTSLVELQIRDCPRLVPSLVSETKDNWLLPTSFQYLTISPLPANMQLFAPEGLTCLRVLSVFCSQYLKSVQLRSCTALECLQLLECQQLSVLEGLQHLSSLVSLDIEMNHELSMAWDHKLQEQEQGSNQVGLFPLSLVHLGITNLEGSVHSRFLCLPSITKLDLWNSPDLKSLQLGYCTALVDLAIDSCKSLASIEGFQSIRNLRSLRVGDSPSVYPCLQLMSQQQGASDIFSQLETLTVDDASVLSVPLCKHLTSLRVLGLHRDGYSGKSMVSLTEEQERALQLLTSLRQLNFYSYQNLEFLPANLRSLDSLEELHIVRCPRILRLPEMGLPPSLKYLLLCGCSEELCMQCRMAETEKLKMRSMYDAEDVMDELDYYRLQQHIEEAGGDSWAVVALLPANRATVRTRMGEVGGGPNFQPHHATNSPLPAYATCVGERAVLAAAYWGAMGLVGTVVDAAIGWMVQGILGSFFTGQMQVWSHEVGLAKDVEMLESEMKSVQMVLAAAEGRRIDNKPLSDSLDELKELFYDAEDRVSGKMNEIITWVIHGRKRKRDEDEPTHSIMLPLEIKHDISQRINGIVNCLHIRNKSVQGVLQLEISRPIVVPKQTQSVARGARLTTSIPIERKVYGRDAEKENIIKLLTSGKPSDLGVLPLVGVGGVGKTTLARFVYHDERIKEHFDLRMWESLLDKIRHKRFLLVLDDIWEDKDRSRWDKLLAPLRFNEANGCMILATTQRTSVARMIGTMHKVEVNGLSDTEFWLLFKAWAFFGNENQEHDPTMQSIGQHIAKALKGNPLAARSVGALLNRNVSYEHWRKVQYKWRYLLEQDDDILTILKFSYEFLPVHLQQCFSYCSLFPKDHKLRGENLVRAWISQNFVECECHSKRLEETGKQYLDNLVDWGFLEEVESHYIMHDLMHDLAEKVSSNECAIIDGLGSKNIPPNVRHLSIITTAYDEKRSCDFPSSEKFENILHKIVPLQKLRTLMFFGESSIIALNDCWCCNLTSLQELIFKVQDASNFNIGQLRSMNELVILGISQLENVKTKEEAKSARLIDKEHLQELSLSWDDKNMNSGPTAEKTRDGVFEGLEPHHNLKHLQLTRYSGATSPTWLASNVKSLQVLHLENCREWQIINSLEMLPVLRKLKLIRMWNLMSVSIPSYLEELILVNTPKLEKCVGTYGSDLTSGLRVLVVKDCPCLNEFTLFHSDYFHTNQKLWFPSLNKLTIGHYHRIIIESNELNELDNRILPFHNLKGLRSMYLQHCPNLSYVSSEVFSQLVALEHLSIEHCPNLFQPHSMSEPVHENSILNTDHLVLPSLRFLKISSCGIVDLEFSGVNRGFSGFTSLVMLQIRECPKLVSSLVTETNDTNVLLPQSLEHLDIGPLPANLQSYFPKGLPCLKKLSLNSGEYLKSGEGYDGETMVSLTEEQERALQLLTSLRVLAFSHLQNLKSLPTNLQSLDCLDELYISVCPSILRLPQMGLPPSLRYLSLYRCSEELCVQCRMAETANLRVGIYSASAIPRPGYASREKNGRGETCLGGSVGWTAWRAAPSGTWYRLLGGLAQSSTRDAVGLYHSQPHVTVSHGIAFLCLHKYISISSAHMVYPALPVLIWQPACQPSIVKLYDLESCGFCGANITHRMLERKQESEMRCAIWSSGGHWATMGRRSIMQVLARFFWASDRFHAELSRCKHVSKLSSLLQMQECISRIVKKHTPSFYDVGQFKNILGWSYLVTVLAQSCREWPPRNETLVHAHRGCCDCESAIRRAAFSRDPPVVWWWGFRAGENLRQMDWFKGLVRSLLALAFTKLAQSRASGRARARRVHWGTMGLVSTAAEAAIGWVVQSILGSFFTGQMQVWTREVGLDKQVEELETEMRNMQMVLAEAEGTKIDNRPLSESLDEIKELIYDAEDGKVLVLLLVLTLRKALHLHPLHLTFNK